MTTLHLPIDRAAGVALHRQIYDALRRAILDGRVRPGQRVPSTRALAAELGVSRLPVLVAFEQLVHEGYLAGRVGSGTYVCDALPDDLLRSAPSPVQPRAHAQAPKRTRVREQDYGGLRPFRMNVPALDAFPHALWARIVAKHAHGLTPARMAYGDPAGTAPLREAIARHLRSARAVRCDADQVIVVSGSQAALRLAAAALVARGDRVAVEEPGYPGARAAFAAHGAELVSVPVDDEGVSVTSLRRRSGRVRAVYVTPSHQYPLGASMTASRRLALLEWAATRGAWILEDDYDSEYRYVSRPLAALQGMDAHERVIYIGTFSKVLFPAVRIGYLVVPRPLVQRFLDARAGFDLFSATLYQLALTTFIDDGHFARHLRRMRGIYGARREALLAALERHCGALVAVHNADAGLHVAVTFADGLDDRRVARVMGERGLTATALSSCYAEARPRSGLLLGFGGWSPRRIAEATRLLGDVLQADQTTRRRVRST